ncbi:hypothetical protein BFP76_10065 [Amylibacter kogurei]|uniref:Uncharacterized protein n=1 Tax=Paramylibacter kogurei TaxID=1889778 RepID=A0A2G5K2C5_9RHOB|nr:DUF2927 domain-containing protein [Amylibacter kogurei]PIB22864.1 hypothetical protein BFP76_10065 [Amylibacter kogurei]
MRQYLLGLLMVMIGAFPVSAQDFTRSSGKLSNQAFYKSIACKAKPGQACQTSLRRWPKQLRNNISVGLVGVQGVSKNGAYAAATEAAIKNAVQQVNAVDAGVQLRFYSGNAARNANIQVHLVKPRGKNRIIKNTGYRFLDGQKANNAISASATVGKYILSSGIAVSVDRVKQSKLSSILLEEVVQSLGLTWDIHNPYYDKRSIFAQVGTDSITKLTGQDAQVLRMHYPN